MSDVLKKPVHLAILKPTHIEKLTSEGKLPVSRFGVPTMERQPLPQPEKKQAPTAVSAVPKFSAIASSQGADLLKKNKKQVMLKVIYEQLPPIAPERKPPCQSCKTAACCKAFIVNISKEEYESGFYGDSAIALTPDIYKQLKSTFILPALVGSPITRNEETTSYVLEGKLGEPCPFLTASNRCGIYDIRPVTCRTYSCVGDARITEGMRQGTEPISPISLAMRKSKKNAK